ncbi:MAG: hypothetical protein ACK5MQ_14955 [Pikeienuella sp.]
MLNRKHIATFCLVALVALAGCRPGQPVYNVNSAAYGATANARKPSLGQVESAIIRAGAKRGWSFTRIAPGQMEGTTVVRGKHRATVNLAYSREDFSITYKDSQNLEYDPATGKIHPNYNSWVSLLEQDIRAEIQGI